VNNRVRCDIKDEPLHLLVIGEVGPPGIDAARQFRGRFSVGGRIEIGGNHIAPEFGQSPDGCRAHQAEAAGNEDGV